MSLKIKTVNISGFALTYNFIQAAIQTFSPKIMKYKNCKLAVMY